MQDPVSSCVGCHEGVEAASEAHPDCVSCHGGDPVAEAKDVSHRTMLGGRNPSAPSFWGESCGRCHPFQLRRVASGLMFTGAGILNKIGLSSYAAREMEGFGTTGEPVALRGAAQLENLTGEFYRKSCARCHIGTESADSFGANHDAGCAACHFPFNDEGTYEGGDPSVQGKRPYSASHDMDALPGTRVCLRCHNRSGGIGYSFLGLNDGNNALVPTNKGLPGPRTADGGRTLTAVAPDAHAEAGLQCIDCHTSRDVMGDGYLYESMSLQTEVACRDCHGSSFMPPKFAEIVRENEDPVRESASYAFQMGPGVKMALTSKGTKYSNVFTRGGKVFTLGKRSGKLHETKVITGTSEHSIFGHERLECHSCHSRTAAQRYGCRIEYDQTQTGLDYVTGAGTPGSFRETEDYRSLYPFPLALNQRGGISPVSSGSMTLPGADVDFPDDSLEQRRSFDSFYSHNTGKKAVGCSECHANPAFLGFGQHVVGGNAIEATLIREGSAESPLDGYVSMEGGKVRPPSDASLDRSRPLGTEEVRRILAVNLCLVCHEKGDDPIYQTRLDYKVLPDCLARLPD